MVRSSPPPTRRPGGHLWGRSAPADAHHPVRPNPGLLTALDPRGLRRSWPNHHINESKETNHAEGKA